MTICLKDRGCSWYQNPQTFDASICGLCDFLLIIFSIFELSIRVSMTYQFCAECSILGDVYEIDVLSAVLRSDLKAFRDAISILKRRVVQQVSDDRFEPHLLEQIDQNIQQNNPYITTPVKLEQSLMEGVYNKVVLTEKNIPSPYYALFIRISMDTVR
ncbi:unnamed protein product [Gongylonema pulchrum]|uniref:CSN8_PSD8_EIF3K domain-containing protein n=1 Tax=Gongylonema pulchrum TaxID=637853 RepID=A0A183EX74_9BILA|nr:unnamed protein product [Gongylonema pulchrum]